MIITCDKSLNEFNLLRQVIAEELAKYDEILKGEIEADGSYFGGKRKGKGGRGGVKRPLWDPGTEREGFSYYREGWVS
jgi:hypothetical protein